MDEPGTLVPGNQHKIIENRKSPAMPGGCEGITNG